VFEESLELIDAVFTLAKVFGKFLVYKQIRVAVFMLQVCLLAVKSLPFGFLFDEFTLFVGLLPLLTWFFNSLRNEEKFFVYQKPRMLFEAVVAHHEDGKGRLVLERRPEMKVMKPILANLALYHELLFALTALKGLLTATVLVQECVVVPVLLIFVFLVVEQLAAVGHPAVSTIAPEVNLVVKLMDLMPIVTVDHARHAKPMRPLLLSQILRLLVASLTGEHWLVDIPAFIRALLHAF